MKKWALAFGVVVIALLAVVFVVRGAGLSASVPVEYEPSPRYIHSDITIHITGTMDANTSEYQIWANGELIYSQAITQSGPLPFPEYQIVERWQVRDGTDVVATYVYTPTIYQASEIPTGVYAGPITTTFVLSSPVRGVVEAHVKSAWVAGDPWPEFVLQCPDTTQDLDGYCYWGSFSGSMEIIYLPLVIKETDE